MLGAAGFGSGVVSHLAGGGRLPGTVVLLLLLAVSVVAAAAFLRGWASAGRLVLLVVAAQTGWHLVLSLLAGHAGDARSAVVATVHHAPVAVPGRRTGTFFDAYAATVPHPAAAAPGGEGVVSHQLSHLSEQGGVMVLTHLLGAVALALFLAWGEASLWRLLSLVGAEVGRALVRGAVARPVAVGVPRRSSCGWGAPQVFHPLRLARDTTRRRGPPLLLAA